MKILFITSGYKGIYDYFEAWIIDELSKKHEVKFFHFNDGYSNLQSLTSEFNPEMALTLVGFKLPIQMVQYLKKQQVKTAVWFTEDPYFMDRTQVLSQYFDFAFTIDSAALEYYKNNGHLHAYQLPLGTEPQVFKPKLVEAKYRSDICLVGFPYPDRIQLIQSLLQNTAHNINVVGKWSNPLSRFRTNPKLMIHEGWMDPSVVANFYNGAKIVLNTHRPFNLKHNQNRLGINGKSINNRTFDVAACGSFQLIQFKEDLPNHFIENEEIVSFKNNEELFQKIDYYLKSEKERQWISDNARNRVLKEHTFEHRLEKMLELIKDLTK
ncbi:glycosyltransferase [Bacillus sp. OK048]|uniref:CgeB family protein n=1 Tax=Bacillus sp. OK048 TaxID=1882761 RepID=UPI00087E3B24|nr:glycosyltransferase [Bacillus sp. OK048]SDN52713.1 spore maturation protein CgeB [Bacillus sp. OK048]